jgi:hypothetical protein
MRYHRRAGRAACTLRGCKSAEIPPTLGALALQSMGQVRDGLAILGIVPSIAALVAWRLTPSGERTSLVSRIWLDTRSVIPAKAGIQLTLLWIPACAGKTIVREGMSHPPAADRCKPIYRTVH